MRSFLTAAVLLALSTPALAGEPDSVATSPPESPQPRIAAPT
jgi:hypothetical protein